MGKTNGNAGKPAAGPGSLARGLAAVWSWLSSRRLDAARDEMTIRERAVMREETEKKAYRCCLFLQSGAFDRVLQGLSIANVVLAGGGEVHALFSYGALKRLVRGNTDAVTVDDGGEGADFKDEFRKYIHRVNSGPISEMIETGKKLGRFKIYACSGSMAVLNITRDELMEGVDESTGLVGFLNLVKDADLTLYI